MKADRNQLAKIHIAQKQLGIDKDTKLEQYAVYGVEHSNELTYGQAEELISLYIKSGFKPLSKNTDKKNWGARKYRELDNRGRPFAKSSKLRKIEKLWRLISYSKTDESLRAFIENRTGVSHITMLYDEHANSLLGALEAMQYQQLKNKNACNGNESRLLYRKVKKLRLSGYT